MHELIPTSIFTAFNTFLQKNLYIWWLPSRHYTAGNKSHLPLCFIIYTCIETFWWCDIWWCFFFIHREAKDLLPLFQQLLTQFWSRRTLLIPHHSLVPNSTPFFSSYHWSFTSTSLQQSQCLNSLNLLHVPAS